MGTVTEAIKSRLGLAPESSEQIVARRAALETELAQLDAVAVEAQVALAQGNGSHKEIEAIRQKQCALNELIAGTRMLESRARAAEGARRRAELEAERKKLLAQLADDDAAANERFPQEAVRIEDSLNELWVAITDQINGNRVRRRRLAELCGELDIPAPQVVDWEKSNVKAACQRAIFKARKKANRQAVGQGIFEGATEILEGRGD